MTDPFYLSSHSLTATNRGKGRGGAVLLPPLGAILQFAYPIQSSLFCRDPLASSGIHCWNGLLPHRLQTQPAQVRHGSVEFRYF